MATWYVNELSKLTGISVQTLHYYDKVSLLQPSHRLQNGYRVYSEHDLLKLQQITALKFFGFSLKEIKTIIQETPGLTLHLKTQLTVLLQQQKHIEHAIKTLKHAVNASEQHSLPWQNIIQLIEVYKMTDKVEKTWVKDVFSQKELNEYAEFLSSLKATPEAVKQHEHFQQEWTQLTNEIAKNLTEDPTSNFGINLGKRCLELLNAHYGKKYAHLRTAKLEKGFGEGKGLEESNLTPHVLRWLEHALDAYLKQRIYGFFDNIENLDANEANAQWLTILDDMYGEDESRKKELVQKALADPNISDVAKNWLKTN